MSRLPRFVLLSACLVLAPPLVGGRAEALPIYRAGHTDIGAHYHAVSGTFDLHYRFGGDATTTDGTVIKNTEIAPDGAVTRTPNPAFSRPEDSVWDFLGVEAGEPVWYIPQTQNSQRPFLGFATDGLESSEWSGPVTWSLKSIIARPAGGEVSLWQLDFFGTPSVNFASADGIDELDAFPQGVGGHDHFNWGFSQRGVYRFEIGLTGERIGQGTAFGSGVFTFFVGLVDGDYNRDGAVDAADYTMWRDTLGESGSGLAADGNHNRAVDAADYDLWKQNFGTVPPPPIANAGSAPLAAVPEPNSLALFLALVLGAGFRSSFFVFQWEYRS